MDLEQKLHLLKKPNAPLIREMRFFKGKYKKEVLERAKQAHK